MKIHSLSYHHDADGGVGEVVESTKHFRRFSDAAKSNTTDVDGYHFLLPTPHCSYGVIQVSGSLNIQIWIQNSISFTMF